MIGILLMSHGKMAEGMLDSCKLFFGDDVEKIKALCLNPEDDPEQFDNRIKEAIKELDDGSGIIAMCDLLGGTPSNRSIYCLSDRFQVITGMNFTMLLELLGRRLNVEDISEIDLAELMETGKSGIVNINEMIKNID
ncbi:MAG: PTS sugar transporter subunit IIA [Erysipelotrichia bacterium]|nr:PTS sugar transporter subunit IIA [Erysipelotrichia bacterium]